MRFLPEVRPASLFCLRFLSPSFLVPDYGITVIALASFSFLWKTLSGTVLGPWELERLGWGWGQSVTVREHCSSLLHASSLVSIAAVT